MTMVANHHEGQGYQGLFAINASMIAFACADIIVKLLGRYFPPNELVLLRSIVIVLATAIFVVFRRQHLQLRHILSIPALARCVFDCGNALAIIFAIIHMKLAEVYAISLTAPFLITLFGFIFYRQEVGYRRWAAITVGLFGALLIIKPNFESLNQWALVALLASIFSAARDTVTRKVDRAMSPLEVTLYSSVLTGAAAALLGGATAWALPSPSQLLIVIAQAISWLIGAVLLVEACRLASLYIVGLFRYAIFLWGGFGGYLVFGGIPDHWSIVGIALIGICGLYSFYREAFSGAAAGPASLEIASVNLHRSQQHEQ